MNKSLFTFSIKLLLLMVAAFSIHLFILNYRGFPLWGDLIIPSYIYNTLISFASFMILVRLKPKWISNMGFIFMGGTLLKFLIFFIAFYPSYQADDIMSKPEFFAFFVPYAMGLITETSSLILRINKA